MILGLGFPGGPVVDARARRGNPRAVPLPRTMLQPGSLDFSFSGLKTAVLYHVHGPGRTSGGLEKLSEQQIDDICASFSAAVVDVLVEKTMAALQQTGVRTVVVGGGVAANSMLRERLTARCAAEGAALHLTPMKYCTDNAAMIAALGYRRFSRGHTDDLSLSAQANVGMA
jgi:N6-L-threonylcarbamoyladenine synthase